MNDLKALSVCALGLTLCGCSYFSERFDAPEQRKVKANVGYNYSNPARVNPRDLKVQATDELNPQPLMDCKSNACKEQCFDPDLMPKPKWCSAFRKPRASVYDQPDENGNKIR